MPDEYPEPAVHVNHREDLSEPTPEGQAAVFSCNSFFVEREHFMQPVVYFRIEVVMYSGGDAYAYYEPPQYLLHRCPLRGSSTNPSSISPLLYVPIQSVDDTIRYLTRCIPCDECAGSAGAPHVSERSYSQFQTLRQLLVYLFPMVIIPPLPEKSIVSTMQTALRHEEALYQQARAVENFLQSLAREPSVVFSYCVVEFLLAKGSESEEGSDMNTIMRAFREVLNLLWTSPGYPLQTIRSLQTFLTDKLLSETGVEGGETGSSPPNTQPPSESIAGFLSTAVYAYVNTMITSAFLPHAVRYEPHEIVLAVESLHTNDEGDRNAAQGTITWFIDAWKTAKQQYEVLNCWASSVMAALDAPVEADAPPTTSIQTIIKAVDVLNLGGYNGTHEVAFRQRRERGQDPPRNADQAHRHDLYGRVYLPLMYEAQQFKSMADSIEFYLALRTYLQLEMWVDVAEAPSRNPTTEYVALVTEYLSRGVSDIRRRNEVVMNGIRQYLTAVDQQALLDEP